MEKVAIISEFNPLHKGHEYLISEVKKRNPRAALISIMSPNFVQRGEPAIFDKYLRGECAVKCGCDLAISMPLPFAILSAEGFAESGVKIAKKMGVDYLAFGVESVKDDDFNKIADLVITNEFNDLVREKAKELPHLSYPSIRELAIVSVLGEEAGKIARTPNNILAIEYIKAIKRFAPSIKTIQIKRKGNAYSDDSADGDLLSATGIRKLIREGKDFLHSIPDSIKDTVISANVLNFNKYENFLYNVLLSKSEEQLDRYTGNRELSSLIKKNVVIKPAYADFRNALSRKKFTETRINRVLLDIILGIEYDGFLHDEPEYITSLAMNDKGKIIIAALRKENEIRIMSKGSDYKKSSNVSGIKEEAFADIIYSRCLENSMGFGYFLKKKPYVREETI